MDSHGSNPDLESFRAQWKAEVRAKHAGPGSSRQQQQQQQQQHRQNRPAGGPSTAAPKGKPPPPTQQAVAQDGDEDYGPAQSFDESTGIGLVASSQAAGLPEAADQGEPVSALEHYEKAVEREVAGNLGDSLRLYRKAFRMDDSVDQKYKNKHFPKPPPKPARATVDPGSASKTEPPQSIKDLVASFSTLSIAQAPPEVEGMQPPPCPVASLPEELLVHILRDVAILDVGDFVRLAQVCKRLAYLVTTEDRIWRRICLGPEFGFGGMHYHWHRQITWSPLPLAGLSTPTPTPHHTHTHTHTQHALSTTTTHHLHATVYARSWQRMFRRRPRLRFHGCYISTVNYTRSGQASANQVTWGSPVHIVTYYRYLRFFRDGTAISLLTTAEPAEVVHHLTREAVLLHRGGAAGHLPSAVMKEGLKGRWRLGGGGGEEDGDTEEGDVVVETEGVSHYVYRLDLTLGSAGKGASNNKLGWKGFYDYNKLTGDWAAFTLRHDKPFFFSRVKSYGVMGA
ncbi:hypothetical protein BT67DRAFT_457299 [Trichocladium antarcticum]|uniref:F-box domain-containing protein n=1 Tax=Trichocladium antarcticum TaxID=1450529 RepID=A0AAN6ZC93_9PEZI|nr:hypothetical protein BT67DRAFT_457299 [Trichocladium antarcticum]